MRRKATEPFCITAPQVTQVNDGRQHDWNGDGDGNGDRDCDGDGHGDDDDDDDDCQNEV